MNYDMKSIVKVMDEKKIEVSYFILNGIGGTFNTIYINAKPDMTISDVFDAIRRKHKHDKNIIKLELLNIDQLKSEL